MCTSTTTLTTITFYIIFSHLHIFILLFRHMQFKYRILLFIFLMIIYLSFYFILLHLKIRCLILSLEQQFWSRKIFFTNSFFIHKWLLYRTILIQLWLIISNSTEIKSTKWHIKTLIINCYIIAKKYTTYTDKIAYSNYRTKGSAQLNWL